VEKKEDEEEEKGAEGEDDAKKMSPETGCCVTFLRGTDASELLRGPWQARAFTDSIFFGMTGTFQKHLSKIEIRSNLQLHADYHGGSPCNSGNEVSSSCDDLQHGKLYRDSFCSSEAASRGGRPE
jgi:hypothetical protein